MTEAFPRGAESGKICFLPVFFFFVLWGLGRGAGGVQLKFKQFVLVRSIETSLAELVGSGFVVASPFS